MPQLSPMMGILVFVLTNLSFITVVLSIRSVLNVQGLSSSSPSSAKNAFRGFS